jgi:hypothetical protein
MADRDGPSAAHQPFVPRQFPLHLLGVHDFVLVAGKRRSGRTEFAKALVSALCMGGLAGPRDEDKATYKAEDTEETAKETAEGTEDTAKDAAADMGTGVVKGGTVGGAKDWAGPRLPVESVLVAFPDTTFDAWRETPLSRLKAWWAARTRVWATDRRQYVSAVAIVLLDNVESLANSASDAEFLQELLVQHATYNVMVVATSNVADAPGTMRPTWAALLAGSMQLVSDRANTAGMLRLEDAQLVATLKACGPYGALWYGPAHSPELYYSNACKNILSF